jgi:hypothetical protein
MKPKVPQHFARAEPELAFLTRFRAGKFISNVPVIKTHQFSIIE